jgi:hypothetical protein
MKKLLLLLFLASPLAAQDPFGPAPFVLYGWGEGGDGYGYGILRSRVDDRGPWGRYDNSVPGYRSHGMYLSHDYYGKQPLEQHVYYVGLKPARGRHEATVEYTRNGVVYHPDDR